MRLDGRPIPIPLSAQRVLAFLALKPGRRARVFVAGHLWIDASEERAAAALRTALWRLRGPASRLVRCEGTLLRLETAVRVDVDTTSRIARECLAPVAPPISPSAFAALRDAGDLLPDWYDDWVIIERECFRQLRLHALETLCVSVSHEGRYADATEAGLAAIATDPLRESAHRALIAAHLSAGNQREGLRQYQLCRALLRRDLDIAPSEQLERLVAHLRPASRDSRVTRVG